MYYTLLVLAALSSTCGQRAATAFTPKGNSNGFKSQVHSRKNTSPLSVSTSLRAPQQGRTPFIDFRDADGNSIRRRRSKRKYKRKRIPESEKQVISTKRRWKADYERLVKSAAVEGENCPNVWSFDSLFPDPILDEASVKQDLFGQRERDASVAKKRDNRSSRQNTGALNPTNEYMNEVNEASDDGKSPVMKVMQEVAHGSSSLDTTKQERQQAQQLTNSTDALASIFAAATAASTAASTATTEAPEVAEAKKVDRAMTRLVEDSMYGYRRTRDGSFQYDTSLMGDGAVKFRDGVRLGKPLQINADRLTYLAKKELQHGRVEEAQELYERAIMIDPQDGRAYLGLSRCAERRRDFTLARECLKVGITHSTTRESKSILEDRGANPFLLQALGCLEEKMGHLSEAEALYVSAAKSRPWHAAAWVALAQLRTRKLGKSAEEGRTLFQTAELELKKAGKKPSAHVYTAWASLEYHKAHDVRRARELYQAALKQDKKCSAAYLQLGVMEANNANWEEAQSNFESVLKFDQRNSRVLQAYALMETKRPDGNSRKAIGLFERALKANPRDAGVLQAYGLYVAKLGDVDTARDLLSRATEVNKRHAAAWQAWGVLEVNEGNPEQARSIFQQGIWACAQVGGCQSGGYSCARLWQAWGVLESREGDHAAARRCFGRALDADNRNVATVTAWTLMEEDLGNVKDARYVFERALKQFTPGSEAKTRLWMTYEKMEQRLGNTQEAQRVYQRSMREALQKADGGETGPRMSTKQPIEGPRQDAPDLEVENGRWDGSSSSMRGEVWLNDGSIESKLPRNARKTGRSRANSP